LNNALVEAAKRGDHDAFTQLANSYRNELLVHCYRMIGTPQDADDLVQTTYLRAWQHIHLYEPFAPFRSWLYRIATNACLDFLRQNNRRGQSRYISIESDPESIAEDEWLQPMPSNWTANLHNNPEAIYTIRESVHLAFTALLHSLPPRQRAVLVLRDVLGWKASEVASALETTTTAVNSALIRARKTLEGNPTLANLSKRPLPETEAQLLGEYIKAWESADVDRLISLLKHDALYTMPPLPVWFRGWDPIKRFMDDFVFRDRETMRWQINRIDANNQPALSIFHSPDGNSHFRGLGMAVFTFEEHKIARVDTFVTNNIFYDITHVLSEWVKYFNLPDRIDQ
jgi:RNA polymerase sigma-70 factor (ECF subfamily)